jgi:hypothetical protein
VPATSVPVTALAGRALDREVARQVFGRRRGIPRYGRRWDVVAGRLRELGLRVCLHLDPTPGPSYADVTDPPTGRLWSEADPDVGLALGRAAVAACRALAQEKKA